MKKTSYITLDVILAIHDNMIENYGGSSGIINLGAIQSAIARPQSSFGGEDLYSDTFQKAAVLFHSLIFNHGFIDGNKRTAMVSASRFLSINGYELDVNQKEFFSFPLKVVKEKLSIEEISKWFRKKSKTKIN